MWILLSGIMAAGEPDMTYRLLTLDEKEALVAAFPQYASVDLSQVAIAGAISDEGTVEGIAVLNFAAHCEPMWIKPKSGVDFRRMVAVVESEASKVVSQLWVFAPDEKIARMAEICGAVETGWKVFRKDMN